MKTLNKSTSDSIFFANTMISNALSAILRTSNNLKICYFIITSIVVNMINAFIGFKFSANMFFHNMSMFINIQKIKINISILFAFTSFVSSKISRLKSLSTTRFRTIYSLIIVKMATFDSKVNRAYRAFNDIIKSSLFARYFFNNNMFIHTIMITRKVKI